MLGQSEQVPYKLFSREIIFQVLQWYLNITADGRTESDGRHKPTVAQPRSATLRSIAR